MATFQAQIEGLTGLSLTASTAPTLDEVTQFLHDGVMDVTQKCIRMNPQDALLFTADSGEQSSQNSYTVKGQIISVVREAGVSNDWRECRLIPQSLQSRVTDSTSLHYASKFNPAYTVLDNGKLNIFPTPGVDPNQFRVYYINNDAKRDSDANTLAYGDSDIRFFPKEKVYLVVIYASMMSLNAVINDMGKASDVDTEIINDDPEMAQLELAKNKERLTEYVATYKQLLHQYNGAFGLIQQRRSPRRRQQTDETEVTT